MSATVEPLEWYWRLENRHTRASIYVGPYAAESDAEHSYAAAGQSFLATRGNYVLASFAAFPMGYNPSNCHTLEES